MPIPDPYFSEPGTVLSTGWGTGTPDKWGYGSVPPTHTRNPALPELTFVLQRHTIHNAKGKQVKHVIYYYMTASAKEPTGASGQEKLGKRDGQF